MKDGSAYGGIISINEMTGEYELPLKNLKKVKSVLLPRPYPKFHAYWFEPAVQQKFDVTEVESLQISIGPGIPESEYNQEHGAAIGWLSLK